MKRDLPNRLTFVDALRGIAVLGVLAIHTSKYSPHFHNMLSELIQQGVYGVQLFYIVSAFTLFLSLSSRSGNESKPIRNFLLRRFFRIAPLFYCAIVGYSLLYGFSPRSWLSDDLPVSSASIIATLCFVNGFNPYWINNVVPGGWSVAVEMIFYLTIPSLFREIKTLEKAAIFTFSTLFVSIVLSKLWSNVFVITDTGDWNVFLYFWLPNQLSIFGLGIVLFFLYSHLRTNGFEITRRESKSRLLLAITAFSWFALTFGSYEYLPAHFLYGITFLGLATALILDENRLVVNSFTVYCGKVSYSAYLTHFALLPFVRDGVKALLQSTPGNVAAPLQYCLTYVVVIGATLLVSTLTYHLVEVPGQKIGRRLISHLESRSTSPLIPSIDGGL